MKHPSLYIATSLAGGILLADLSVLQSHFGSRAWMLAAIVSLAGGGLLAWRGSSWPAWAAAMGAWMFLGGAASTLQRTAVPTDIVTALIQQGRIETNQPLRWTGRLRQDPVRLPWGLRYDIELEQVQVGGDSLPVRGGLQAQYFREPDSDAPPNLRAGDRVEALVKAGLPHNYANPGGFDYRQYLARQGIQLTGSLRSGNLLQLQGLPAGGGGPALRISDRLARIRGRLLDTVDAMLAGTSDRAAVARAMLLGDRSFVDHERVEAYQQTGVYHVLVIAGLHVAALAAFLFWIGRRLRLRLIASVTLTMAALGAFVLIVEDRPPILRAAMMAAIYLLARLWFRRISLINTVALAALALLAYRPSEINDPSFLLSFVAAGTIAALAVPWMQQSSEPYLRALDHLDDASRDGAQAAQARPAQLRLDLRSASRWLSVKVPRLETRACQIVALPFRLAFRLWELAVLTIAIQIGLTPMMANYFHRISVISPLANIPAVLLAALIVPFGLFTLGVAVFWPSLGHALGHVLSAMIGWLDAIVDFFARWHGASYRIPGPPAMVIAAFFMAAILLAWATSERRRALIALAAMALMAIEVVVCIYPFVPRLTRGDFELTVLDVGQGDSLFAAFPDGRVMLIDGGGALGFRRVEGVRTGIDIGEDVVSPYLWSRGLKRIDVVALTHPHEDHIGGLTAVLRNFRVGELWIGREEDVPALHALLELAAAQGVRVVRQAQGVSNVWGGADCSVLWPVRDSPPVSANDDSMVLRVQDGQRAWLLTGDIEKPVETALLTDGEPLEADFLKVPHHGSKTSSTEPFLAAVHPRYAAISVGANNVYGHPSHEVTERLAADGIVIYRTDEDGAISSISDGQTIRVQSYLHPSQ
jgi:competence protein ComEC